MLSIWTDFLLNEFSDLKNLPTRIVIDCSNGSGYETAKFVTENLGLDVTYININGEINKGHEVMQDFDIGFRFDGDADRCTVVTPKGDVHGDGLLAAFAVWLKKRKELADCQMVGTILFNSGAEKWLNEFDITLFRVPVGDKHVCEALDAYSLTLGGEESGHVIYTPIYHAGDGLVTALLTLRMLNGSVLPDIPLASTVTKNFLATPDMKAFLRTDAFKKFLTELNEHNQKTRIVIRPSGTEDLVRVLVESL